MTTNAQNAEISSHLNSQKFEQLCIRGIWQWTISLNILVWILMKLGRLRQLERGSWASSSFLCTSLSLTGLADQPSFLCLTSVLHLLLLVSPAWSLIYHTEYFLWVFEECLTEIHLDCYWDLQWAQKDNCGSNWEQEKEDLGKGHIL